MQTPFAVDVLRLKTSLARPQEDRLNQRRISHRPAKPFLRVGVPHENGTCIVDDEERSSFGKLHFLHGAVQPREIERREDDAHDLPLRVAYRIGEIHRWPAARASDLKFSSCEIITRDNPLKPQPVIEQCPLRVGFRGTEYRSIAFCDAEIRIARVLPKQGGKKSVALVRGRAPNLGKLRKRGKQLPRRFHGLVVVRDKKPSQTQRLLLRRVFCSRALFLRGPQRQTKKRQKDHYCEGDKAHAKTRERNPGRRSGALLFPRPEAPQERRAPVRHSNNHTYAVFLLL